MTPIIRARSAGRWAAVLGVSAAVGLVYALRHILIARMFASEGLVYFPVTPLSDPGYFPVFWTRVREVLDGHFPFSDLALFEYRNGAPLLLPWVGPLLYAGLGAVAGLRMMVPIGDFLTGFSVCLVLFLLLRSVTGRFLFSLCAATAFALVKQLPFLFFGAGFNHPKDLLWLASPYLADIYIGLRRVNFSSMESVKPGFFVFGLALLSLFSLLKNRKHWAAIALGFLYGASFYTYPYYWIYLTITLGLLFIAGIVKKDWVMARAIGGATFAGLALSSYFWWTYLRLRALPHYDDLLGRSVGVEVGHQFRWSQWYWYLISLALLFAIFRCARSADRRHLRYFFGSLIVAALIGFNIQVVTGVNFQPMHWSSHILFLPLALAEALLLSLAGARIWRGVAERRFAPRWLIAGVIPVFFIGSNIAAGVESEMRYAAQHKNLHVIPPPITASLDWIAANLPADAVVVTPSFYTNELLGFFTSARVFVPHSYQTTAPQSEILDRALIAGKIFSVQGSDFMEYIQNKKAGAANVDNLTYLYGLAFASKKFDAYLVGPLGGGTLPKETAAKIGYDYEALTLTDDALARYRMDYMYFGPDERAVGARMIGISLDTVYEKDGVTIYRVPSSASIR